MESNHQSALSFLNDGLKGINYYFETPAMLMRDLLARQDKHIKIINGLLHGMNQRMDVTVAGLIREEQTEHAVDLFEHEYKTYASNKETARTTLMVEHLFDGNQQPFSWVRGMSEHAYVIDFYAMNHKCMCDNRVGEQRM